MVDGFKSWGGGGAVGHVGRGGVRLWLLLALLCGGLGGRGLAQDAVVPEAPPVVQLDFYYEPGCPICEQVRTEVLPLLELEYEGLYRLTEYDTGIESNYLALVQYQASLEIDENATAIFILEGSRAFAGWGQISGEMVLGIEEAVVARLAGAPLGSPVDAEEWTEVKARQAVAERVRAFTPYGVALAGLVDGINPCAISTLVFFLSLLSVLKVRDRRLLMVGVLFCLASFVTYTAIGFGLLRLLHLFQGFSHLRLGIKVLMVAVLTLFAFLSFRDAWRFRKRHDPHEVTLQLPRRIKLLIHRVLHSGLEARHLAMGSIAAGVMVTALESVCTGQVYVPALVLMVESGEERWRAARLLLVYNALFISPLVIAFILTYRGLKTASLLAWSREHVVSSKVLLGALFVLMAALLLAL